MNIFQSILILSKVDCLLGVKYFVTLKAWSPSFGSCSSRYGCERTGSDKRQNCRLSCRVKLSFRKINGNRRKWTHRTCATIDNNFQATSDKILNFYNFMRALLRQATIFVACRSLCVDTLRHATLAEGSATSPLAQLIKGTFLPSVSTNHCQLLQKQQGLCSLIAILWQVSSKPFQI